MNRRDFIFKTTIAAASGYVLNSNAYEIGDALESKVSDKKEIVKNQKKKKTVAFFLFEDITPLDLIGPTTALDTGKFNIEYVWHNKEPLRTEIKGVKLYPTTTFEELKYPEIVCVPGSGNPFKIITDTKALKWLFNAGKNAQYVTSVCTGSIVLAAANLMNGYEAATHWSMEHELSLLGAIPVRKRIVIDRNRITGGGVTAGIDFGLTLLSILESDQEAKLSQLLMQYDPEPPFSAGTPDLAGEETTALARSIIFNSVQNNTPSFKENIIYAEKNKPTL